MAKSPQEQLRKLRSERDTLDDQIAALEQQIGGTPARKGGGTPAGEESRRNRPDLE